MPASGNHEGPSESTFELVKTSSGVTDLESTSTLGPPQQPDDTASSTSSGTAKVLEISGGSVVKKSRFLFTTRGEEKKSLENTNRRQNAKTLDYIAARKPAKDRTEEDKMNELTGAFEAASLHAEFVAKDNETFATIERDSKGNIKIRSRMKLQDAGQWKFGPGRK